MITMEEFYQNQQCNMEELAEMLGMCRSSIARQRTGDVIPSAAILAIINNWDVCGPMLFEAIEFRQQLQDQYRTHTERLDRRNASRRDDNSPGEEVFAARIKAANSSLPSDDRLAEIRANVASLNEPSFL